jgi:hypothetical protein
VISTSFVTPLCCDSYSGFTAAYCGAVSFQLSVRSGLKLRRLKEADGGHAVRNDGGKYRNNLIKFSDRNVGCLVCIMVGVFDGTLPVRD